MADTTNNKIAVIGDKDSVLAFKAVGADVFNETNPFNIRETVKRLAREGYALILITERQAEQVSDVIERFKAQPYPVILPIPDGAGATGMSEAGIKENMIKAIGTELTF
jgi:V/A-type H+-transporting ATPase subunit F